MPLKRAALCAAAAALLLADYKASGQNIVRDEASCSQCSIVIRRVASLGDVDGPGALASASARVRIDGHGRYWVAAGGLPQVFGADGRFVAEVGGRGQGPGEFLGAVNPVPVTSDSVLVVEPAQMRGTLFDSNFRPGRVIQLPGRLGIGVVMRWPERLFATGMIQSTERFGWPIHIISLSRHTGDVLRSGGNNEGQRRPNETGGTIVAVSGNGELWTNEYTASGYRLIRWDSSLTARDVLEREPKSWRRTSGGSVGSSTTPPDHAITSFAVDREGLLWVFQRVPGKEWRAAHPKLPAGAPVTLEQVRMDKLFGTVVEVIDRSTKRVLVRAAFDTFVIALPNRRAAASVISEEGIPTIDVLELSIIGR